MSNKSSFDTVLKITSVAGCFILNLPLGIVWYYGNLSTYTNSYFLFHIGKKAFNVPPEWLLSVLIVSYVTGVLTVDWWTTKLGTRFAQLIALVAFNVGTFLSYFAVQHSTALMMVSFIMCTGYTTGWAGMITLVYARKVMPERVGLTSAVVSSAYGLGAIINNYAITAYINPDNLTPDVRQDNMVYFSQAALLDKVPAVFFVTGFISLSLHSLGYLLEQLPLFWLDITDNKGPSKEDEEKAAITQSDSLEDHSVHNNASSSDNIFKELDTDKTKEGYKTAKTQHSEVSVEDKASLKPSQVLRKKSLHILWFSMGAITYGIVLTQNYYKLFGQLWIKDDTFLVSIGSFVAVSNGVCRIIIGFVVDVIGVKRSVTLVLFVNSIMLMFWYITPMVDRWLYFCCCQLLAGVQGTLYVVFPMAALKLYGPTYYATNFGLILVANVVADLLSPVVFAYLQGASNGWFGMATVGSVLSTLAMLTAVVLMPEDGTVEKKTKS